MIVAGRLRRNAYFDSISLMRVAEEVRSLPGVDEVALVSGNRWHMRH